MSRRLSVPLIVHKNENWGALSQMTTAAVDIVAERFDLQDAAYSFVGGHRVRLYRLKKNIHFKVPAGTDLNITDVLPGPAPRRQPPRS